MTQKFDRVKKSFLTRWLASWSAELWDESGSSGPHFFTNETSGDTRPRPRDCKLQWIVLNSPRCCPESQSFKKLHGFVNMKWVEMKVQQLWYRCIGWGVYRNWGLSRFEVLFWMKPQDGFVHVTATPASAARDFFRALLNFWIFCWTTDCLWLLQSNISL